MWENRHGFPIPRDCPEGTAATPAMTLEQAPPGWSVCAIRGSRSRRPSSASAAAAPPLCWRCTVPRRPERAAKPAAPALSRAIEDEYCAPASWGGDRVLPARALLPPRRSGAGASSPVQPGWRWRWRTSRDPPSRPGGPLPRQRVAAIDWHLDRAAGRLGGSLEVRQRHRQPGCTGELAPAPLGVAVEALALEHPITTPEAARAQYSSSMARLRASTAGLRRMFGDTSGRRRRSPANTDAAGARRLRTRSMAAASESR